MIWKEVVDNQLFVFYNGELIYKKWLNTGRSIVINKVWGHYAWEAK
jgi:hypothetical protein